MLDIQAGNVNAEAGDVNVNVNAECKCLKGAEPGRRPGERLSRMNSNLYNKNNFVSHAKLKKWHIQTFQ
jgi:hypothetical protein